MRKMIAALLAAASLAAPAAAQWRGGEQREREQSDQRGNRAERPSQGWRQERAQAPQEVRQPEVRPQEVRQPEVRHGGQDWRQYRQQRQDTGVSGVNGDQPRREWQGNRQGWQQNGRNWQQNQTRQDWQQGRQDGQQGRQDWQRNRQDWQQGRNGWSDNRWQNNQGRQDWNREWRRDPRYNYQDWRQRNRNSYQFPRYYAPRGWSYGYQRFSFGAFLSAPLFSQNYWIGDPYEYSLPPAYGPYRWVRYYDDVLLVDIRDGQVVDVIYGFFW